MQVKFYETASDAELKFAVIAAKYEGKWVFCKHRCRDTYECPGGHREVGETIRQTAERELWEETGAVRYDLKPVSVYSVIKEKGQETFGMLYAAQIYAFDPLPVSEIEGIALLDVLPAHWTYPQIQPILLEKAEELL